MSNLKTVANRVNKQEDLEKEKDISFFNQTCQNLFDEMSDKDLEILQKTDKYEDYPQEFLDKYGDKIVNIGLLDLSFKQKYHEHIPVNSSTINKKGRKINGY